MNEREILAESWKPGKEANGNLVDKHVLSKMKNSFNVCIIRLNTSEERISKPEAGVT